MRTGCYGWFRKLAITRTGLQARGMANPLSIAMLNSLPHLLAGGNLPNRLIERPFLRRIVRID